MSWKIVNFYKCLIAEQTAYSLYYNFFHHIIILPKLGLNMTKRKWSLPVRFIKHV